MLTELNLPTLQERRNRAKLQMFYKITHHLVAIPDNCLTPVPPFLRSEYFKQLHTNVWTVLNSPSSHQPSNYGISSRVWWPLIIIIYNYTHYLVLCIAVVKP